MRRIVVLLTVTAAGVAGLSRIAIEGSDPAAVAIGGLRYLALAAGWYVLLVSGVGLAARVTRSARLVRLVDLVTLPGVRHVLNGAVGLSLMTGTLAAAPAGAAGREPSPPPVMRMLEDARPAPVPVPVAEPIPPPTSAQQQWVVRPGDHLWSIASRTVAEFRGRTPSDGEVAVYWRRLIEANRSRFRTGDPDLIFAGQTFLLPPVN